MSVRRWAVWAGWLVSLTWVAMPVSGQAVDVHAPMRAAMAWLATPWSDAQEKALQAHSPPRDRDAILRLPGSTRTYRRAQLASTIPDWWPQDHPAMPTIVARGRGKGLPCAECHGPGGKGIAHTATLAGLPAGYIVEQLQAFRDGSRVNDEMHFEASHVSVADVRAAAAYFSGLRLTSRRVHVVQVARVPKTHVESWMLVRTRGGGTQAIGDRVIELPLNEEHVRLGDERARFVAYVPSGSVARGRLLATSGAGKVVACASCHGADLRGVANIPPLAGRSPTYITRQLVQLALGNRQGVANQPMQHEVSRLSLRDMISVAAYAASLKP